MIERQVQIGTQDGRMNTFICAKPGDPARPHRSTRRTEPQSPALTQPDGIRLQYCGRRDPRQTHHSNFRGSAGVGPVHRCLCRPP